MSYDPGPSNCVAYPTYEDDLPENELVLAHLGSSDMVVPIDQGGKDDLFPHREAMNPPDCPLTVVFGEDDTGQALHTQISGGEELPGPPRCPPALTSGNSGCHLLPHARSSSPITWFFVGLTALAILAVRNFRALCEARIKK